MTVRFYAGPQDGFVQENVPDDVTRITFDLHAGAAYSPTSTPRFELHIYTRVQNPNNVNPVLFKWRGFQEYQSV